MPGQGPTVRRRRLAHELRRLREAKGMTIEQVAKALECSDSKISRIETGRVGATPRDVRDMLALYDVDPAERETLMRIAREARQRGWWHALDVVSVPVLIGLEADAASISAYAALLIPGLLQTEQYARTILGDVMPDPRRDEIEDLIKLRMARQERLREPTAPKLTVVLDEAVLRRPIGGHEAMYRQLEHLSEIADLPTVTLLVLPLAAGGHAGTDGEFTIIRFSDPADADVVYLESHPTDSYVEDREEVGHYLRTFERLQGAALRAEPSKSFFASVAKELR